MFVSYEYDWRFVKCTYHTYSLLLKILPCALYASPVSKSKQSYVTTDSQLASLSWHEAPIWGLRLDLYYYQTVAGLLMWGAVCDQDGSVICQSHSQQ
jgi:hypothetical protein